MLLTDKNAIIININDKPIEIVVNFKVLENLYHCVIDKDIMRMLKIEATNPFEVLEKIDDINYISVLLYAMSNGEIEIEAIKEALKSIDEYNELTLLIKQSIYTQLKTNDENNTEEIEKKKSDLELFEEYFNYFYVLATTVMKYSIEEFYNFTPAKLKEISNIYREENKGIIISAYIDIMKAQNGGKENTKTENSEVRKVKDANEFFDLI